MARTDVKARILQAAKAVFARRGYRATTVSDILLEADVARGTFYRYFTNKRNAFYELVSDLFKGIYEVSGSMLAESDGHIAERIEGSFAQSYSMFIDNRGILLTFMREGLSADPGLYALWDDFDRKMTALFSELLDRGAAAGEFRKVDNELVSRAMLMLFLQVPYRDLMMGQRVDLDVRGLAGEMVNFVLEGILLRPPADTHR
ncbi:MAG: TetR/AcrR family transcriptional regulator [Candidatus Geothermincolia bacterium]